MGKAQKLFAQWSVNNPKEVHVNDVKTFLNAYFKNMWNQKGSSHMVVRCEALKVFSGYKPYGEISVPVKGGTKVKGVYIKELIKAVQLLLEVEGEK